MGILMLGAIIREWYLLYEFDGMGIFMLGVIITGMARHNHAIGYTRVYM